MPPHTVIVQKGVVLKFATVAAFSSGTAKKGDEVPLRLTRPLMVDGITLLPVGAEAQGRVRRVKKAGPTCAWGEVEVEVSQVRFPDASTARTEVWLKSERPNLSMPEIRPDEHEILNTIPEIILYAPLVPFWLIWAIITGDLFRSDPPCVADGRDDIYPAGSSFGVVVVKKHRVQY